MSFLIAEILLLLVVAAILGGALVYWFVRRHFVDVSSEYERYEHTISEARALRLDKSAADARIAALQADKTQLDKRLADEMKWRSELETILLTGRRPALPVARDARCFRAVSTRSARV